MRPTRQLVALPALLVLLLSAPLAAAQKPRETPPKQVVALGVPFYPADDVPEWTGFALSSVITDVYAQNGEGSWVGDKQLDAVLRRKDLQLYDAADTEVALPLARSTGATDLIVGEVLKKGDKLSVTARRLAVNGGGELRTFTLETTEDELPAAGQQLAEKLLDARGKLGPMTKNGKALKAASSCWAELVRHPLQPRVGTVPPLDNAEKVTANCRTAVELDPAFGWAHAGLAILTAIEGRPADGRSEAVAARKDRFVGMSYVAEAYCARRAGDRAAARAALEAGVKVKPGFLLALGYLAEERMEIEDWKGAVELWDKLLKRAPQHPFALGQKAHAVARLGHHTQALALTRQALDIDKDDPELLIELASRQIDAKKEDEAIGTLKRAMEARPPRPLAWLRLGYIYLKQGKAAEAKDVLTEARVRGLAFADLAIVSGMQNNYTDAIEYLSAARAEGLQERKIPCSAAELKQYKGRKEYDSICPGTKD